MTHNAYREPTPDEREDGDEEAQRKAAAHDLRKDLEAIIADNDRAETERLADIDKREAAEMAFLPRGAAGIIQRSNVQVKYQRERYGSPPADPSLLQLQAERDAKKYNIPNEIDGQAALMEEYRNALSTLNRGDIGKISQLQALFRARGLSI